MMTANRETIDRASDQPEYGRQRGSKPRFGLTTLAGAVVFGMVLGLLAASAGGGHPAQESQEGALSPSGVVGALGALGSGFVKQVQADLDTGEYGFFPNRRSIWVLNRTNGRMANYNFRDDEVGSVDRSRIAMVNLKTFPTKDTVIMLSDRNLNNILWVCNVRTGDVQMWHPATDGSLTAETPLATSADLRTR